MKKNSIENIVITALNDLKGNDITVLDVKKLTSITDTMVICSGRSTRHNRSLCDNVVQAAKDHKISVLGVEGENGADWILIDLADVVVHIMLPTTREFYNLEKLWSSSFGDDSE